MEKRSRWDKVVRISEKQRRAYSCEPESSAPVKERHIRNTIGGFQ